MYSNKNIVVNYPPSCPEMMRLLIECVLLQSASQLVRSSESVTLVMMKLLIVCSAATCSALDLQCGNYYCSAALHISCLDKAA